MGMRGSACCLSLSIPGSPPGSRKARKEHSLILSSSDPVWKLSSSVAGCLVEGRVENRQREGVGELRERERAEGREREGRVKRGRGQGGERARVEGRGEN